MVSRNFILPESANYVFFYAFFFLRNLSYNIAGMGDHPVTGQLGSLLPTILGGPTHPEK